jgi:hypothetical protein
LSQYEINSCTIRSGEIHRIRKLGNRSISQQFRE